MFGNVPRLNRVRVRVSRAVDCPDDDPPGRDEPRTARLCGAWRLGRLVEVALFDQQVNELASDEDELHEEKDLSTSLVNVGLPEDEARSLAGRLVPQPRV